MRNTNRRKQKITAGRLEKILATKAYRPVINELTFQENNAPEVILFEKLNLFRYTIEDYREEYNTTKLPTAYEFAEAYQFYCKRRINSARFRQRTGWKHKYTKALHKAIWNRATRAYVSYMVEYHAKLVLNSIHDQIEVVSSTKLDIKGVDLLVKDYVLGVQVPIHVYKCSSSGLFYRYKKEGKLLTFQQEKGRIYKRAKWEPYYNKNYSKRDTTAHLNLYYMDVEEDNGLSNNINGYPLLKPAYILDRYRDFTTIKWAYLINVFDK